VLHDTIFLSPCFVLLSTASSWLLLSTASSWFMLSTLAYRRCNDTDTRISECSFSSDDKICDTAESSECSLLLLFHGAEPENEVMRHTWYDAHATLPFVWPDWVNPWKTWVMIVDIRTGYHPNENQTRCCCGNPRSHRDSASDSCPKGRGSNPQRKPI
jgi:hypothetical protein